MNPLETRAMPGSLWEKVPPGWVEWDLALREWIVSRFDASRPLVRVFKDWTEKPLPIAFSVLGFLCLVILKNRHLLVRAHRRRLVRMVGATLAFWMLADGVSYLIKRLVGRLKPHVGFFNPNLIPALSLPSNHAFNLAFLCALLWFSVGPERRKFHNPEWILLSLVVIVVSFSRVALGEHYPLDILFGWGLGIVLANTSAKFLRKSFV